MKYTKITKEYINTVRVC